MTPIYILGLNATTQGGMGVVMSAYVVIGTLWAFLVHANVRWNLRWVEPFLATPRFHHWHHTNDSPQVLDKNYAAIFPWIDRLFGTLYMPANARWPAVYGTDTPMPEDLIGQLVQPFKAQTLAEGTSTAKPI
jgi:sterol desaturase/sphingolipid hydroxylase (fatty acid hydroxylase superfamily)